MMTLPEVLIDGQNLSIEDLILIRDGNTNVKLDLSAKSRMQLSQNAILEILNSKDMIYGINTGFGAMSNVKIDNKDLAKLQVNLIRSHACGVGDLMEPEHVLMMMAIRSNSLAVGHSGIRPHIVEVIIEFINKRICPVIPRIGSLGASGDLAPLSHLALGLIGESDFLIEKNGSWELISPEEAFKEINQIPISLAAKEGLSLINGTSQMCAFLSDAIHTLETLVFTADCSVACSIEAIKGSHKPFDSRIHATRPHHGQSISAARILSLLSNSEINKSHINCDRVQDAYSLRCAPQVHGPVIEALTKAREILTVELNSATDNPLIFLNSKGEIDVISGGNFHGQPLALMADNLAICSHELGSISERRTNLMMNPKWTDQKAFLAREEGLESGLMILQYVSAACLAEMQVLSTPASIANVPVSMGKEDHVSMGATSSYKLLKNCEYLSYILANEMISNNMCLRNIDEKPGDGVMKIRGIVDDFLPEMDTDLSFSEVTENLAYSIRNGLLHNL